MFHECSWSPHNISTCIISNFFTYIYIYVHVGPYSAVHVQPVLYRCEMSNEAPESPEYDLPILDVNDCNRLLAARLIQLRFAFFLLAAK